MQSDILPQFILLFFLLLFSSYFSICEIALTALSRIKLKVMLDNNVRGAKTIENIVNQPRKLFSTILMGSNITNILAPVVATSIAIKLGGNNTLSIGISTVLITVVVLIYCEMAPKMYAVQNPDKISLLVAGSVAFFMYIFTPFIHIFSLIAEKSIKLLGADPNKEVPFMTEDELKSIISVSHKEGILKGDDKDMIENVFGFRESQAKDIMTPRTDMIAIPYNASYEEIDEVFQKEYFSRMPVYKENFDEIIGILHFKDFIYSTAKGSDFKLEDVMRKPFFTYELKSTKELFQQMKKASIYVAIILDEYGGTAGIVTLEDLIEEIVGEINDEYDEEEIEIEKIATDEYLVDGATKIEDINRVLGTEIYSDSFDSIGGYVMGLIGHIPDNGHTIEGDNIKFIVEKTHKNKIEQIRIFFSRENS